ncbi:response regulator receiver domain protein [Pseudoflavonifractor capillosus ATCC 29799]|uniref:Heme response regulator HssR n=1 Tax=Pseudoflavonifractor capillosus ATCC 29799 TaxID=411467 RepID=A6NTJ6_9FIRM|nr:response regulator transcription factor [Pseudoflavonifractor capillosus]EDN00759.1 response regulator receiver domain protein [Pseudoflavonifractor capillosus ATCC 29799]
MFRILVVEDDNGIRMLMEDALADAGYEPVLACNGLEALEVLESKHIDLIILDIMMPKMDGYELLRQIRESGMDMPVLLVTAKQTLSDKKKGFLLGADDYMVKPFEEEEMLLRVAALLRRAKILTERKLTVGSTELIYDSLTVISNGTAQTLPKKEFLLLYKLLSFNNKTFTRRQLMDEIWDLDTESDEHTVNVHINKLRDRFRDNHDFEIVTVRGLGYKAVKR